MSTKYFGTDGIRGLSFSFLTAEIAYKIGQSFKEVYNLNEVVIGHDTRDSSPMLAHMVAAGALSAGINVSFAGVVPTPLIANYSKLHQSIGVMVTASHNPYTDNGIKVFNKGYKSSLDEELIIEQYINGKAITPNTFGVFKLSDEVELEYLKLIDSLDLKQSKLKVVYDSAHGANYLLSNKLFNKYYPNSKQIGNKPNGKNINLKYGSTQLDSIKEYIVSNNMDIGFAYDGDGDRIILLDNEGTVYDGDFILYLIAKQLNKEGMLKKDTVVFTKMTNPGIIKALKNQGIKSSLTDVGDKNVFKEMFDNDYSLGGESSGHIIIRDILHSGDGLLASLYILKVLEENNLSLKDYMNEINLYPFKMVNIKDINKDILNKKHVQEYLDNCMSKFDADDIFLIRASGTEPLIRVTISCEDENKLNKYIEEIVLFLKKEGK